MCKASAADMRRFKPRQADDKATAAESDRRGIILEITNVPLMGAPNTLETER